MILLIDHFDSFVYNLARYIKQLGYVTRVVRYNEINIGDIKKINPTHIILSPGPCGPDEVPFSMEIVKYFSGRIPILGVCLGHQIIAQTFGGRIERAKKPMHGKSSFITHSNKSILQDLAQPLKVGRYHSLIVSSDNLPDCFDVLAESTEHEIMAIAHKTFATFGVQFHPESVLTEEGYGLLERFLITPHPNSRCSFDLSHKGRGENRK